MNLRPVVAYDSVTTPRSALEEVSRMRSGFRVVAVVLAATGAGLACRHAATPVAASSPTAPPQHVERSPAQPQRVERSGSVGVSFLTAPGTQGPTLGEHQEFIEPRPVAMPSPAFPADALAAGAPPSTVVVRIVVGTDGHVAQVTDSPLAASTTGPYAASFRAAVEAALARWDFHPGFIDTVKDGLDLDGDGKADYTILLSHQEVPVTCDVGFEFRIVDGDGVVTQGIGVS